MAQSIKALKQVARKLQRKVEQERRRQEVVVALQQTILSASEEYSRLRFEGSEEKLFERARDGLYRHD